MSMRVTGTLIGLALAVLLAAPVSAADSGLRVEKTWARASIGTSRPAAAYVTIANGTDGAATLTAVSSPVSGHAAVHKTVTENGVMKMLPAGPVEIPAGGRLVMKPGGLHIMLMELKRPIKKGTTLKLRLEFADGTTVDAEGPVMGPGAMGPGE